MSKQVVREKIAEFLKNSLEIPEKAILVEQPLLSYGINSEEKVDIVIHRVNGEQLEVIGLVECTDEGAELTDAVFEKAFQYSAELWSDYVFVTNGEEMCPLKYDPQTDLYMELEELPTYAVMAASAE